MAETGESDGHSVPGERRLPGHLMAQPPTTHDSAGTAWSGRELHPNPFSGDTGEADAGLAAALTGAHAAPFDPRAHVDVVAALRGARVYAPVLPTAVEHTTDERGFVHDNKSEMAMVRLASDDGRECVPCFTDIPTLTAWHPGARPVPVEAERLGAAAVEEGAELVVVDPGSDRSFLLRRPALWAFLQRLDWQPSWADAQVAQAIGEAVSGSDWIASVGAGPGSAGLVVAGPELAIELHAGRRPTAVELAALQEALAASPAIAERVDSLTLHLTGV